MGLHGLLRAQLCSPLLRLSFAGAKMGQQQKKKKK
jgi:hypothetical protein